jgi:hypothetical protein
MTTRWVDVPCPALDPIIVMEYRFGGKTHHLHGPAFKTIQPVHMVLGWALFGNLYETYEEWIAARDRLRWVALRITLKFKIRQSLRRNKLAIEAYYSLEGKGGQKHAESIEALGGEDHRGCTS